MVTNNTKASAGTVSNDAIMRDDGDKMVLSESKMLSRKFSKRNAIRVVVGSTPIRRGNSGRKRVHRQRNHNTDK